MARGKPIRIVARDVSCFVVDAICFGKMFSIFGNCRGSFCGTRVAIKKYRYTLIVIIDNYDNLISDYG